LKDGGVRALVAASRESAAFEASNARRVSHLMARFCPALLTAVVIVWENEPGSITSGAEGRAAKTAIAVLKLQNGQFRPISITSITLILNLVRP
jgi:hypothetical protein